MAAAHADRMLNDEQYDKLRGKNNVAFWKNGSVHVTLNHMRRNLYSSPIRGSFGSCTCLPGDAACDSVEVARIYSSRAGDTVHNSNVRLSAGVSALGARGQNRTDCNVRSLMNGIGEAGSARSMHILVDRYRSMAVVEQRVLMLLQCHTID